MNKKMKLLFAVLASLFVLSVTANIILISHYNVVSKIFHKIDVALSPPRTIGHRIPNLSLSNQYLEDEIILVIGHAYGIHGGKHEFIAPKIAKLIEKNADIIDLLVFTGDVLENPTVKQWQKLDKFLKQKNISYAIAPGNHDYGHNFFHQFFTNMKYPTLIETEFSSLILVDTMADIPYDWVKMNALFSGKTLTNRLFILGHHILNPPLREYSNAVRTLDPIQDKEFLRQNQENRKKLLAKFDKIYFVSGDTGAFDPLPSLAVARTKNIIEVASGIGEQPYDYILAIHNGVIKSIFVDPNL